MDGVALRGLAFGWENQRRQEETLDQGDPLHGLGFPCLQHECRDRSDDRLLTCRHLLADIVTEMWFVMTITRVFAIGDIKLSQMP